MRQAESSRDTVHAAMENSCLWEVRVLFVAHVKTSADRSDRRPRADNLQSGTVEAGRVTLQTRLYAGRWRRYGRTHFRSATDVGFSDQDTSRPAEFTRSSFHCLELTANTSSLRLLH